MGTWVQHFDNSDWSATYGSWDGSKWVVDPSTKMIELTPIGTWANGYRPTKIRVTFGSGGSVDSAALYDSQASPASIAIGVPYSSGTELTITFAGYDIGSWQQMDSADALDDITNIEFYEESSEITGDISEGFGLSDQVDGFRLTGTLEETFGLSDEVDGFRLSAGITEGLGLSDGVTAAGVLTGDISDGLGLSDQAAGTGEYAAGLSDGIGFSGDAARYLEIHGEIGDGIGFSDADDGFNWTRWLRDNLDRAVTRFYLTLTGDADGLADLELPMASFQGRFRSGDPSYLEAVVPGLDNAGGITARPNGDLVIEMAYVVAGQESVREEIGRVDFENLRIDEGATGKSLTLSGHRTESYDARIVTLAGAGYRYLSDGALRYRAKPDMYLRPGNTVVAGDDEFVAGYVWLSVGAREQVMEVTQQMDGLDWQLPFTDGSYRIRVGDVITGDTSGQSATVGGVRLTSGSWAGGDAAGTLVIGDLTGDIVNETLSVGSHAAVAATTGVAC